MCQCHVFNGERRGEAQTEQYTQKDADSQSREFFSYFNFNCNIFDNHFNSSFNFKHFYDDDGSHYDVDDGDDAEEGGLGLQEES